jgi:PTS system galactitol-specific IIB component
MIDSKFVLVSCGAGVATSTAVAVRVRELCEKEGIQVKISCCMASEIPAIVEAKSPDLIVATVQKPPDLAIPFFNGMPYLTGIGANDLDEKIINQLKN